MACIYCISGTGVGLTGDFLEGSASFVIDTKQHNSFITSVDYSTVFCDQLNSNIKASYQVSNFKCDFREPFTEIITSPQTVEQSGRYVKFLFEIERDSVDDISPRVIDFNVKFIFNKKEYDYNTIYKLKSDIFGLQYALMKPKLDIDLYNYKFVDGDILVKDVYKNVIPLNQLIPETYNKYKINETILPNAYNQMISAVKDFELFYDTFMFVTEDYLLFEKTIFDYNQNKILIDETFFKYITLTQNNLIYSDVWFFEKLNQVLIFNIKLENNIIIPVCYWINIITGDFKEIEIDNLTKMETLNYIQIDRIETPVLTYDSLNNNFNMGMIIYDTNNQFNLLSIDLKYDFNKLNLDQFNLINQVDYSEQ